VKDEGWGLPDRLEVDGRPAALVIVANDAVTTYQGTHPLRFCPDARFELGLDWVGVEHPGATTIWRAFLRARTGQGVLGLRGAFGAHDVDRVEVRCRQPLPLQADGEDLGDVEEVVFDCERDAVSVFY
jgi:diacylglycerol kinase family enzyme